MFKKRKILFEVFGSILIFLLGQMTNIFLTTPSHIAYKKRFKILIISLKLNQMQLSKLLTTLRCYHVALHIPVSVKILFWTCWDSVSSSQTDQALPELHQIQQFPSSKYSMSSTFPVGWHCGKFRYASLAKHLPSAAKKSYKVTFNLKQLSSNTVNEQISYYDDTFIVSDKPSLQVPFPVTQTPLSPTIIVFE